MLQRVVRPCNSSGTLAIGDTIFTTNGVEAPQLSEFVGQLTIDTSSAFTVNPNSIVKVGVTFGGGNDALIVTGTAGVLRLEGGLLSVDIRIQQQYERSVDHRDIDFRILRYHRWPCFS